MVSSGEGRPPPTKTQPKKSRCKPDYTQAVLMLKKVKAGEINYLAYHNLTTAVAVFHRGYFVREEEMFEPKNIY